MVPLKVESDIGVQQCEQFEVYPHLDLYTKSTEYFGIGNNVSKCAK